METDCAAAAADSPIVPITVPSTVRPRRRQSYNGPSHSRRISGVLMFVHQSQLVYQLAPADYSSLQQHRRELDRLFLPTWHLVGCRGDVPRDGDFVTFELLGHPVLIHNFSGTPQAFLNVCAHRHCQLVDARFGHRATLRCQYHAWEYGPDGRTRRIPDAGCFRPFDREQAQLQKLRLAACGDLLFVSLVDEGPTLSEFLGDCSSIVESLTTGSWQCNWRWEYEYPCNWKLAVENTVETYHLPSLHTRTFSGIYPAESAQTHDLAGRGSTLRYDLREDARLTGVQRWFVKRLGGRSTDVYTHYLIYPHLVLTTSDLYLHAHVYLPVTPTTSRAVVRMYSFRGAGRDPWRRLLGWMIAYQGRRMNRLVQREDAGVMAAQQRGIEASPHTGCLGTREERIWAFQRYVCQQAGSQICAVDDTPKSAAANRA